MVEEIGNPPRPSPSSILTLLDKRFATTRSGFPSRLKSPTATASGATPETTGEPGGSVNAPLPLPNSIVTLSENLFATARSGLPSRLKSPTAAKVGARPAPTGEPAARVKLTPLQPLEDGLTSSRVPPIFSFLALLTSD